jgi:hypothetical protein
MKQKFTIKENIILTEIYRRLKYVNKTYSKTLTESCLKDNFALLETPSYVKTLKEKNIITPSFQENPRVLNWYKLTDNGVKLFKKNLFGNQEKTNEENENLYNGKKTLNFNF